MKISVNSQPMPNQVQHEQHMQIDGPQQQQFSPARNSSQQFGTNFPVGFSPLLSPTSIATMPTE
jgi:hypothetical protein